MICSLLPTLIFFILICVSTASMADEPLGIVKTKPTSGRFVKTNRGFMVPYKTRIPGTDVDYEMVPIPGGTYLMGSPKNEAGRSGNEGPQIKVKVRPFWMGKYEVTWNEFHQYMDLTEVFVDFERLKIRRVDKENQIDAISAPSSLYDPEIVYQYGHEMDQPAAMMTQYSARQYTKWISLVSGCFYRLPTGAEWEYACRAGAKTAFHFGDDPSNLRDYAWFHGNSEEQRHSVGQKKPNRWGLYDMHGNVAEWVIDYDEVDGYSKWKDKTIFADRDVRWPRSLDNQIVRGGSFELKSSDCRSASILASDEGEWKDQDPCFPMSPWWFTGEPAVGVGFRIIRPLTTPMTRELREKFHGPDVNETMENVKNRINANGRSAFGIVDEDLPQAIKDLRKK